MLYYFTDIKGEDKLHNRSNPHLTGPQVVLRLYFGNQGLNTASPLPDFQKTET